MKKLFFTALVAICTVACNSNADNQSTGDSTSNTGSDTISSGSSGMQGGSNSGNSNMQGTGAADTGFHGSTADSSRMTTTDTTGRSGSGR